MYSRKVGDDVLTFGVSGKLWQNALVMYDRETDSLWSHFTGEGIRGKHEGTALEIVTSVPSIAWKEWRGKYPETKVLSIDGKEDLDRDVYAGYHNSDRTGMVPIKHDDKTFDYKDTVIGVEIDEAAKAYPYAAFPKNPFIADTLGETPIAVYHNPDTKAGAVWLRRHDEKELNLTHKEDSLATDEAGNTWDLLTGRAVDGPAKGSSLEGIGFIVAYWFAWRDFHPDTATWTTK